MVFPFKHRFGAVLVYMLLSIAIFMATRSALLIQSFASTSQDPVTLVSVYAIGALFDLITALYLSVPFILLLTIVPERLYQTRIFQGLIYLLLYAGIGLVLFDAVAEWLFWDEFDSRFNFIAVDYLVYTHEVIGNIRESYPLTPLLSGIAVTAGVLLFLLRRPFQRELTRPSRFSQRLAGAGVFAAVTVVATATIDLSVSEISQNRYDNELASNGVYSFFAAFRDNELDYATFYPQEDHNRVMSSLHRLLTEPDARFTSGNPDDITRHVVNDGKEKKLNVVLITVESLSAEYLGMFGSDRGASPYLDELSRHSLMFTRLYATGTRTVRGLEALSLSLPPTPGRSIVKRPDNSGLFNLGEVFREHGYVTEFLYGGHGYFDNMNAFFDGNGFKVVDRTDLDDDKIHFANIWGVADEDIYTRAMEEIDQADAQGKPFFGLIMTTSNHRPYTYPEGRIDIPPHSGRSGAVKYTDYAIHDFIERARKKPWFDDTLFVIVADHCGKSAGKTAVSVDRYHIPLLVYSPKHIQPRRVDTLASQIDVGPTLLGLLNFDYDSRFFGQDILAIAPEQGRALIGNYQKLGYLTDHTLTLLSPREPPTAYQLDENYLQQTPVTPDPNLVADTIAFYQGASWLFHHQNEAADSLSATAARSDASPSS